MAQGLTPQEQEELRVLLGRAFQESEIEVLLAAFGRLPLGRVNGVTRQDFQGLHTAVAQLVEGQRTWQEGQRVLQEDIRELHHAVAQLVEGQLALQEGYRELREGQQGLQEGQRALQEAMTGLAASHQQLAAAQARTEYALKNLARQVGGLSETVGGDIEDIAYIVLHDVLRREFGWQVGILERVWQQWNGELVEINVFGQAHDPNRPDLTIWIVGEAKHNLTLREVNRFARQAALARQHLTGTVFPVCFCYRARPEVQKRLHELDIRLVFSYGRLLT